MREMKKEGYGEEVREWEKGKGEWGGNEKMQMKRGGDRKLEKGNRGVWEWEKGESDRGGG